MTYSLVMRISLNCLNETCYSTPQPGPYHHPHHHHPHQFFMQPQQGLWPHVQSHNMVSNLVLWVFFVLLSASVLWVFYHLCPWKRWENDPLGFTVQSWVKITQSWCIPVIWIQIWKLQKQIQFNSFSLQFFIWCSESISENYPRICFWTKKSNQTKI